MNILIVSQHFWPEQFRINMVAQQLLKRGHKVTVLTGIPNYPKGKTYSGYKAFWFKKEKWKDITILRVPMIPRGSGGNFKLFLNYLSFMASSSLYSLCLIKKNYDAILTFQTSPIFQALPSVLLKKILRIPHFLWVQDLWPESLSATKRLTNSNVNKIVGSFVRFIYRNSDRMLIASEAFESSIKTYCDNAKISYLPNSCEAFYRPISPASPSQSLLPKEVADNFKVMFAGNLGSAQALSTLVKAAQYLKESQIKNITWLFVGSGSEEQNLRKMITECQLEEEMILLGSFPTEEMPEIIAQTDLCLATLNKSPIFALTIPSKIQSYLACAKPIITAIDGEVVRLVEKAGCGEAVGAEEPIALAKAILKLRDLPKSELVKLGQAGRDYFLKHFQNDLLADKLCNLLQRHVDNKTCHSREMEK